MSFIVSSTGKIETMIINDIPNQFILFHPITKKDLSKIKTGVSLSELQSSQILKDLIANGSLIKYTDFDKNSNFSNQLFEPVPVVLVKEIENETGEDISTSLGSDKNFVFTQLIASTSWIITHNLNKVPSVTIEDLNGEIVEVAWRPLNANIVIVEPDIPLSGKAYLN